MIEKKNNTEAEVKKTGHIYDGIEELDNAPPNWFTLIFYVTIFFGAVYFLYYSIGDGPTLVEEYQKIKDAEEYALYEAQVKGGSVKALTEEELKSLMSNQDLKIAGAASFKGKCVSCHGAQGQGGIGPNLTDAYWIHGGKMTDILNSITLGIPDKGMPSWGAVISASEIQALTVFIHSLQGTKPSGAKAPQGELIK